MTCLCFHKYMLLGGGAINQGLKEDQKYYK